MGELKRISIALLGGSTSGKTTFFSGIDQAFRFHFKMFGDVSFALIPETIRSGITANDDSSCKIQSYENENFAQRMAAAETLTPPPAFNEGIPTAAPAFGGGMPNAPAFGGAPNAPVFGGTSSQNKNEEGRNISISEGDQSNKLFNGTLLSAELEKAWAIDPKSGFRPGTATTKYVEVSFRVEVKGVPKCRLLITDYAGELLDHANNVPEAMLKELSKHIANSNAAIILANSRAMSKHIRNVITQDRCMFIEQQTRDALSAVRVNDLMQSMNVKNYSVLLAITQCDSPQVDYRLVEDNFARAALDLERFIYQPTFASACNRGWSRGIIPVSAIGKKEDGSPNVNENNSEILPDADINQWNIDTALLFCIYNAVFATQKQISEELNNYRALEINSERRSRRDLLRQQNADMCDLINIISSERKLFESVYQKQMPLEVRSEIGEVKDNN